ncbi:hypothetical protein EAE96_007156 [Botrytis aclada]|nr:hypothetical protein EAE96_007156 [Botrytis aclada]
MSSGERNISAMEGLEIDEQQNTPGDTQGSDLADNGEPRGGLTDDQRSDASLQNVVSQDAAVENMQSINAEIQTRFNQYIQTHPREGHPDSRYEIEALMVFYARQLRDLNDSSDFPAFTAEIDDGIPIYTMSRQAIDAFLHFYANNTRRQSHVRNDENNRNKAIDEILTPVVIDETQTDPVLCPICNEKYDSITENGGSHGACMVPDCKHVFGRECINTWLKDEKKSTCPMCRAEIDIPSDSSDDNDDGDDDDDDDD